MIYYIIPHRQNSLNIVHLLNRFNIFYLDEGKSTGLKVVFVSDGLSDISYKDFAVFDDVYIFLTSVKAAGACEARNVGLKHVLNISCNNDHVVFFDDDDFIDIVDLVKQSTMILSKWASYCLDYSIYNGWTYRNINPGRINQIHEKVFEYNIYGPPFRHILSVSRLKEKKIFWDVSLVACQDWDFFSRFYCNDYKPIYLPGFNLVYNELLSGITNNSSKILEGRLQFFSKWKSDISLDSKYLFFFNSLLFFLKRGKYIELFKFCRQIEIHLSFKALLFLPQLLSRQ